MRNVTSWTAGALGALIVFWIIKHGIKLAGMPVFGPTHSDEEIRGLAAFVRRLPETTAEEYASRRDEGGASVDAGHTHGADTSADRH